MEEYHRRNTRRWQKIGLRKWQELNERCRISVVVHQAAVIHFTRKTNDFRHVSDRQRTRNRIVRFGVNIHKKQVAKHHRQPVQNHAMVGVVETFIVVDNIHVALVVEHSDATAPVPNQLIVVS